MLLGDGWNDLDCSSLGTSWHESDQAWSWSNGLGPPPAISPEVRFGWTQILAATDHIIIPNLLDTLDDFGLDYVRAGDQIDITTSGNALPGLAYGRLTMPATAGFLAFEYQLAGMAADEVMSLSLGDKLLWTDYTDTPAGEWNTGIAYVEDLAGRTESLIFALNPGTLAVPNDVLRIRNVRLYDNTIFDCTQPCDTNCDGSINQFDIQPFINLLIPPSPPPCSPCAGDANANGTVNQFDIQPFIECLMP